MVEVFKTSIEGDKEAEVVRSILKEYLGYSDIAFDLDDCDRILRVEARELEPNLVIKALEILKIDCQILKG